MYHFIKKHKTLNISLTNIKLLNGGINTEAEEDIRRIFRIGGSYVVTLPPKYLETHNIKPGDKVRILFDDFIHIKPIKREELTKRLEKVKAELEDGQL
jgi:antitoxin component of MazEF toxin-antitoxin module